MHIRVFILMYVLKENKYKKMNKIVVQNSKIWQLVSCIVIRFL